VKKKRITIDTVLFDLDDTLLPTTDILRKSFLPAYALIKNKTSCSLDQFIDEVRSIRKKQRGGGRYYYSQSTFEKYLIKHHIQDEDPIVMATKMFIAYNDKRIEFHHNPKTYRDALAILDFLWSVDCSIIIVTTGDKWDQHEKIIRTGLISKIHYLLVSQKDDKSPTIRSVIRYAGFDPKKTLFIGDNPENDIDSAKKNGCIAFRIKEGRRKNLENGLYKPDKTFSNIRDLLAYLKSYAAFS